MVTDGVLAKLAATCVSNEPFNLGVVINSDPEAKSANKTEH